MKLLDEVKEFLKTPEAKARLEYNNWAGLFCLAEYWMGEKFYNNTEFNYITFNAMNQIVNISRTIDKNCITKAGFIPTGFLHSPTSEIIDLTSMTGINDIHQLAFLYPEVRIIIIPNNITSINSSSFCCEHSVKMIYNGTVAEYDAKLRANMNSYVISEVYCSDGCVRIGEVV